MISFLGSEDTSMHTKEMWESAATLRRLSTINFVIQKFIHCRCNLCQSVLTKAGAKQIGCHAKNIFLNRKGTVIPKHQWYQNDKERHTIFWFRDPSFSISNFIMETKTQLRTWRRVFWRLWSLCHTLKCSKCDQYFQVSDFHTYWRLFQMLKLKLNMFELCTYHPLDPVYPEVQFRSSNQPEGQFPCCKEKTFRFCPIQVKLNQNYISKPFLLDTSWLSVLWPSS